MLVHPTQNSLGKPSYMLCVHPYNNFFLWPFTLMSPLLTFSTHFKPWILQQIVYSSLILWRQSHNVIFFHEFCNKIQWCSSFSMILQHKLLLSIVHIIIILKRFCDENYPPIWRSCIKFELKIILHFQSNNIGTC